MKHPTAASLKKVTAENLVNLGIERLAQILVTVADTRPELKRRLRMELAAEQGADHLAVEIDRRLASLDASRSKVSWRQRPTFVRDVDVLRDLIAGRLAELDRQAALDRMWLFMDLAKRLGLRVRDRDGELAAVFLRGAGDIGSLLAEVDAERAASALVGAVVRDPFDWAEWLPAVLAQTAPDMADAALRLMSVQPGAVPGWITLIRQLADAAGDVDAYMSSYTDDALRAPLAAAEVAKRLLASGRVDEAGKILADATPPPADARRRPAGKGGTQEPDFDWETVWIDYLDQSGQGGAAQASRWASFERTLSVERAKAFTRRLTDFEDVEAEGRAFEFASHHSDFQRGLAFLMAWPALGEAARMIQARSDDVRVEADQAELWAAKLRARHPAAAHLLLRKAAAAAFRRGQFVTSDKLTQEADSISL
ncbi:MAG: hypothetical protein JWQ46_1294 [Phenylobacterium sp.]|nr:hypothetical protein [Phenylobacterium sp.]